ncbi:hypothetical protein GCM10010492_74320 [Saccharothrix mutabilis subsp. mutabilis]|uniref:DUF4010 domain-containing protein n=1 Tax=Saccharothrix mutabilis subsp. mutabilis TaxID=66855 RepID=A0ABN0UUZ1_9PSEU
MDLQPAAALATALAVGLLLGVEREHDATRKHPAGSRTFPLIALGGAVAAALSPSAVAVGLAGVCALVVVWYWHEVGSAEGDIGATTEVAAVVAYLLGALAWSRPQLAVAAGVLVAVLLAAKRPLHRFATGLVGDRDVADAMTLFVVAFVVLPLLPDRPLGPYGVLNPAKVWGLVLAVTLIGWAGYLAARALGRRWGLLVAGFGGGFVSGSATTAVMGRRWREVGAPALPAALAANISTLAQLVAVTAVASPAVSWRLLPAAAAGAVVLAAEVAWLTRRLPPASGDEAVEEPVNRPMSLRAAIGLALVLVALLVVTRAAADRLGGGGAVLAAGLGGLADAHAAAVAAASLAPAAIPVATAVLACGAALAANTVVKLVLALVAGGPGFAARLAAWLAPVVVVVGVGVAW